MTNREETLHRTDANVAAGAWTVMHTGPVGRSRLAYTVGLYVRGLPEIAVFDMPPPASQQALNELGERMVTQGAPLEHEERLSGFIGGFDLRVRKAGSIGALREDLANHLGHAIRYARHRGDDPRAIEVIQLLVPDLEGRFVDEPGNGFPPGTQHLLVPGPPFLPFDEG